MSRRLSFQTDITLVLHRCWKCGNWWGVEERVSTSSTLCPCCTHAENESLRGTVTQLGATISALKGALTKAKKRWQKKGK